jgi:hypothetical protein
MRESGSAFMSQYTGMSEEFEFDFSVSCFFKFLIAGVVIGCGKDSKLQFWGLIHWVISLSSSGAEKCVVDAQVLLS